MKQKILVADDRKVNRDLMRACLEPLGYAVTVCASASEALEKARAEPPDLIISDIHMDPTSGVMLCTYFKQEPGLRHIPFMLFSASYPTAAEIAEAHKVGADCCLTRPVDPRDLVTRVDACLHVTRA
jgi:CheY-like chemotaxis protein